MRGDREAELVSRLAEKELELASLRNELAHARLIQSSSSPPTSLPVASAAFPTADNESYLLQHARLQRGLKSTSFLSDEDDSDEGDELAAYAVQRERWTCARGVLVDIACSLREALLVQSVFRAWLNLFWERRLRLQTRKSIGGEHTLAIFSSLEAHRLRLVRSLHEAHLENRWHRCGAQGLCKH